MRIFLLLIICISSLSLFGQKEGWNWYFGEQAGLDFSNGDPVALTDGAMSNGEGVASVSDTTGSLLFYTNGLEVYGADHTVMPNGFGLLGHPSSSQSGVIVRKPSSTEEYYVFTVDYLSGNAGLNYSIVDMTMNGGLGDLTVKNELILSGAREKVTAVRHENGIDEWIVVVDWLTDDLHAYLLDENGLNMNPVISEADSLMMMITSPSLNRSNGYLKVNRQGDRLAMGLWKANSFDLFDFDNSTGMASNHIKIQGTLENLGSTYGVEFSPDGTKLYGTTAYIQSPYKIYQFDLEAGSPSEIFETRYLLHELDTAQNYYFMALQLGPNGKIYCALKNQTFLGAINHPDSLGEACDYVNNAVSLDGRVCQLGLPNMPSQTVLPNTLSAKAPINNDIEFAVYPNPVLDELRIQLPPSISEYQIRIYDLQGRLMQQEVKVSGTSSVNVSGLNSGIYNLTVEHQGRKGTRRFIKEQGVNSK